MNTKNQTLDLSPRGLALIKHFEGCYLRAYKCPAGVWTIGWGHTGYQHNDGTVYEGRVITPDQAEALLKHDLFAFAARVRALAEVELNEDEFNALVSFDFNTGGFAKSTLRAKLNAGDKLGAAQEFLRWNKAGGQVLNGLTRRRMSEKNLFEGKADYIVAKL